MNKKKNIIIAILILILLFITVISGYITIFIPLKKYETWTGKTTATIESVEYRNGLSTGVGIDNGTYRYIYSYVVNGHNYVGYEYSKRYRANRKSHLNMVGVSEKIRYNEDNPSEFLVEDMRLMYLSWGVIPLISGVFLLLSIFGAITGIDITSKQK